MVDESARLTIDDVKAAATVGRLGDVARQFILEGQWGATDSLLQLAAQREVSLDAFVDTARVVLETFAGLHEAQRQASADELEALRRQLARALARRAGPAPVSATERQAAAMAGALLAERGDLRLAAELFERAGDDDRAAEAFGAVGDLDNMERCLARDEARRTQKRAISQTLRQTELLLATGARAAAVALARALVGIDPDTAAVRARAKDVERRLRRGRSVAMRLPSSQAVCFCAAPAAIGRDVGAEIVLRDPTISRRHALVSADGGAFSVTDTGSRTGTRLAGALLGAPLRVAAGGGPLDLQLGDHGHLALELCSPSLLRVRAGGGLGLDRTLVAFVSLSSRLDLGAAVPEAEGLSLLFSPTAIQLCRPPAAAVRVGGRLCGPAVDLLAGDVIELSSGFRLEVLG